jgi:hypothetical protein
MVSDILVGFWYRKEVTTNGGIVRIILPKTLVKLEEYPSLPLFFLAGPIKGGGDWQREMCRALEEKVRGDFLAAIPCRYKDGHPLFGLRLEGTPDYFDRQLTWERFYLQAAAKTHPRGCLIFWLPVESAGDARTDGLPYAMDTRGELGEWRGRMMHDSSLRVAIGAEPNFPGLSQITRNFGQAVDPNFMICERITQVAGWAAEIAGAHR